MDRLASLGSFADSGNCSTVQALSAWSWQSVAYRTRLLDTWTSILCARTVRLSDIGAALHQGSSCRTWRSQLQVMMPMTSRMDNEQVKRHFELQMQTEEMGRDVSLDRRNGEWRSQVRREG